MSVIPTYLLSLYLISYILLLSFGILVLRYLVPRDYLKHGKLSPIITFLQALLFFLFGGFPYLYLVKDWPAVHVSPIVHIIGMSLICIGLGFLFYGMIRLGIIRSLGRGAPHLIRTDLYRLSRNPQAIACGLYVVGFTILWPSWYALGWMVLYFLFINWMVLAEEEHLRKIHGQTYMEYYKLVPRYFSLTFCK